ncbi:MAG TPA: hypothetical protein VKA60_12985 [Blastocatellia bacterium]|nr:hypothetical protein [Blastocatellia bacterium]
MSKLLSSVLAITFILLSASGVIAARGGPQQAESASTRLALEITYFTGRPPAFQAVGDANSPPRGGWFGLFRRIPSWQPPPGSLPVRAVNILSRVEGDAVRVTVSVFLGERLHEKEQSATTLLVRENEKVTIGELIQFGVEPFEIRVVKVAPRPAPLPRVTTRAASISAIGIEARNTTLPAYKVSLQNLSGQGVAAVGVEVMVNGQRRLSTIQQGKEGEPLIPAGAVYELNMPGATDAQLAAGGYRPEALPDQEIVITAAVFADHSYEGNAATAAQYRAYAVGRKAQISRILPLLQTALDSPESTLSDEVNTLKAQVASLSTEADVTVVDQWSKEFPTLNPAAKTGLKTAIEVSLNSVKNDLLKDLQEFKHSAPPSADSKAFRKWLRVSKERYEAWRSRL